MELIEDAKNRIAHVENLKKFPLIQKALSEKTEFVIMKKVVEIFDKGLFDQKILKEFSQ